MITVVTTKFDVVMMCGNEKNASVHLDAWDERLRGTKPDN